MICELRDMAHLHAHLESNDKDGILRDCVNKYSMLLSYRDSVQDIFGPIILQMFISNALQLCACLFILSQLTANVLNTVFFIAYLMTKISETCLCAFAGSQLITESEDLKHAIYCTSWHGDKRLMKHVKIALNQRPMTMVAVHYTMISLNVIVSVNVYATTQKIEGAVPAMGKSIHEIENHYNYFEEFSIKVDEEVDLRSFINDLMNDKLGLISKNLSTMKPHYAVIFPTATYTYVHQQARDSLPITALHRDDHAGPMWATPLGPA
ncbi:hypothetical protein PV325_002421 [Microctonus aethiopoides]|nr:hypothetical protein PV325_002421 [Microctonus aethiopoides]